MATIVADKALYEIVVINNNSQDNTNEVCQEFATKHPDVAFRCVFEPIQGVWAARHRGVVEAQSELLAQFDDDQTVLPNYVDAIIKAFDAYPEYDVVGGSMFPLGEDGLEPKFYSRYLNPFFKRDLGNVAKEYPNKLSLKSPTAYYPPGGTTIFKKEVFEKYGNYPLSGNEPDDLWSINNIKKHNVKILYAPDIVIYHHIPKDRYDYKNLMQTAYKSGTAQAQQGRSSLIDRIMKFMFVVGAGIFYFVTFRPVKGRYLIAFQYNWLKGYTKGMAVEQ